MDLSIIIVNWNTKKLLEKCLLSIYETYDNYIKEIIVVDNMSTDGSQELIHSQFPHVKLIENPFNEGFAKANNRAIKIARGKYILLLNPDTKILNKNHFKIMIEFMNSYPKCGICGCKLLNSDMSWQPSIDYEPSVLKGLSVITGLNRWVHDHTITKKAFGRVSSLFPSLLSHFDRSNHQPDRPLKCGSVLGAHFLMRRQMICEVGLLDEDFFLFGEEYDYAIRARKCNWDVIYFPCVQIIHHQRASQRKAINLSYYWYVVSYFHLMKHYPRKQNVLRFLAIPTIWIMLLYYSIQKQKSLMNRILTCLLRIFSAKNYMETTWALWIQLNKEYCLTNEMD